MNKSLPPAFRKVMLLCLMLAGVWGLLIAWIGNENLFLIINARWTPVFGQPARFFSLLGESWAMGFLLLISLWLPFRKTLLIGLTWLSGALHSWLFKLWLCKGWPRPLEFFQQKGQLLAMVEGAKVHHWNSFPSGHTLTAFSLAVILPLIFPAFKQRWLYPAVLLALLCGLSRVLLVQHWPLDVLGGILLGCSAAFSAHWLHARFLPETTFPDSLISMLKRSKG